MAVRNIVWVSLFALAAEIMASAVFGVDQGEAASAPPLRIISKFVARGFERAEEPRLIDTVVIHSAYVASSTRPYSLTGLLREFRRYRVAPHYLVDRMGRVYQLVRDQSIAYHAGLSRMSDGRTNANRFSLGVELMDTKTDTYTAAQYRSLRQLLTKLKKQYPITSVVGHGSISLAGRTDPWNFDWAKLDLDAAP